MVELEVLLLAGCVDLGHGPTWMSVSSHKSLREVADPKEQGSAPASARLLIPKGLSALIRCREVW